MAYSGKYTPRYPEKYVGNADKIIYRSLWERKFMAWCDTNSNVLKWGSEEIIVPYIDPSSGNKPRRYFPDFIVQMKTNSGDVRITMFEVKPAYQCAAPSPKKRVTKRYIHEMMTWATNQAKWTAAEAFCKDKGWDFKVLTENDLGIKS